jgi:hypothetical protein
MADDTASAAGLDGMMPLHPGAHQHSIGALNVSYFVAGVPVQQARLVVLLCTVQGKARRHFSDCLSY